MWKLLSYKIVLFISPSKGYLELLSEAKVQRGILVFVGMVNSGIVSDLKGMMDEHNMNTFFYTAYIEETRLTQEYNKSPYNLMTWNQVQMVKILIMENAHFFTNLQNYTRLFLIIVNNHKYFRFWLYKTTMHLLWMNWNSMTLGESLKIMTCR